MPLMQQRAVQMRKSRFVSMGARQFFHGDTSQTEYCIQVYETFINDFIVSFQLIAIVTYEIEYFHFTTDGTERWSPKQFTRNILPYAI